LAAFQRLPVVDANKAAKKYVEFLKGYDNEKELEDASHGPLAANVQAAVENHQGSSCKLLIVE